MKYARTFTIDEINIEKLKEEINSSKLINDLLNEHFRKKDIKNMTKEELVKRKAILLAKIDYEQKIKEIENATTN